MRKVAVIILILLQHLGGCQYTSNSTSPRSSDLETADGIIEYLAEARLPAIEDIRPWPSRFGKGVTIETAHYRIYTTLLEPLMLRDVPALVESAYRGYQKQLPEPVTTTSPFTIYLFKDREQWEEFTKDFTAPHSEIYLKIRAGAYYLNGACVAYNIGRDRTLSVLGHEGWHQFNSRHFKYRLPSWLDEGIAMQFETSRRDKGLFYFEPAMNLSRLGSLKKTLIENNLIPLSCLIATNPGEVVHDFNDTSAFYSQSYALVRFLREEDYGKRLARFHALLMDGLEGQWPLDEVDKKIAADRNILLTAGWNRMIGPYLFNYYITADTAGLDDEYRAFCNKITYHVRLIGQ